MARADTMSAAEIALEMKRILSLAKEDYDECVEACAADCDACLDGCGPDDKKCVIKCGHDYRKCVKRCKKGNRLVLDRLDALLGV